MATRQPPRPVHPVTAGLRAADAGSSALGRDWPGRSWRAARRAASATRAARVSGRLAKAIQARIRLLAEGENAAQLSVVDLDEGCVIQGGHRRLPPG